MKRLLLVNAQHDFLIIGQVLNEFSSDVHGGPGAVIEHEFAFFVPAFLYFSVCLGVFQNFDLTINSQVQADLLIS